MESEWSKRHPGRWQCSIQSDWKGKWIASDLELSELQKELKALPDFGMETEAEMWKLNEEIGERTDKIKSAPAVYLRKEFDLKTR